MQKNIHEGGLWKLSKSGFVKFISIALLIGILLPTPALAVDEFFRQTKEYITPDPFLQPDFSGGGFTQNQTIAVPPSRSGAQPDLKLSYSSQSIGEGSPFGAGWSLNIPYIERLNKLGVDSLYNQDKDHTYFYSSLSGELTYNPTTTPLSGSSVLGTAQIAEMLTPIEEGKSNKKQDIEKNTLQDENDLVMPNGYITTGIGNPVEIRGERTLNSKKFITLFPNGKVATSYHIFPKPIHYRDNETGTLKEINTQPLFTPFGFEINDAPYKAQLDVTGKKPLLIFTHGSSTLSISSPLASSTQLLRAHQTADNTVLYPDLFGPGIDLEIIFKNDAIVKNVVFRSKEALTAFTGDYVEIPFILKTGDTLPTIPLTTDSSAASTTLSLNQLLTQNNATNTSTSELSVSPSPIISTSTSSSSPSISSSSTPSETLPTIGGTPTSTVGATTSSIIDTVANFATSTATSTSAFVRSRFFLAESKEASSIEKIKSPVATDNATSSFSTIPIIDNASTTIDKKHDTQAPLPTPPLSHKLNLKTKGKTLEKNHAIFSQDMTTITDNEGNDTFILPPLAHANGTSTDPSASILPIDISYNQTDDGTIAMVKRIPRAWLEQAMYPVRTDATFTFSTSTIDGFVQRYSGSTEGWSTLRTGSGTYISSDGVQAECRALSQANAWRALGRCVFKFDTASIPDNDTVATATLKLSVLSHVNQVSAPAGDAALDIVSVTTGNDTSLSTSDYTYTNFGTTVLGSLNFASTTDGQYNNILLTPSAINITGVTSLGGRTHADTADHEPTVGSDNDLNYKIATMEATGTTTEPYLEIMTVQSGPSSPINLLTEAQTNPGNIGTTTPHFSAVVQNATTTLLATQYQIQFTTASTSWSLPYWDSGKITLASSTPTGVRIADVVATTTFPMDGTKYFWRIKFFDQNGNPGSWSTGGDFFTMNFQGVFRPKIENGDFIKYTYFHDINGTDYWQAIDKRGTQYFFGSASTTRQGTANGSSTYRWMLDKTIDTNGNSSTYTYAKDSGQIYPWKINYGGNAAGMNNLFEVEFLRESRSDISTSSLMGFPVTTNQRIKEILVRTNGQLTHRYLLSYTTGDNSIRSLLSSVQESAWNSGTGTTTLPAIQYAYSRSTPSFTQVTDSTKWQLPGPSYFFAGNLGDDQGRRLVDVTGDGLPDIVGGFTNTGTTWATSSLGFPINIQDPGVRMGDINGDGRIDIVRSYHQYGNPGTTYQSVYLGKEGGGWTQETTRWVPPILFADSDFNYTVYNKGVRLIDVNGDGLADITGNYGTYINNGSQWVLQPGWIFPAAIMRNAEQNERGVSILDVNGDGLPDVFLSHDNFSGDNAQKALYLNTGSTWELAPNWTIPAGYFVADMGDQGGRFADLNGDGLPDITGGLGDYLNTNSGWVSATGSFPVNPVRTYQSWWSKDLGVSIDDINGDGLPDVVMSRDAFEDCNCMKSDKRVWLKDGLKGDLLTKITNEKGGVTNITYKGSAQLADDGTIDNPSLQINLTTIKAVGSDPSFGGAVATSTYTYKGGLYYYNNERERQFAGFATTTKTNASGYTVRTQYHQGNGSDSTHGEYGDDISKAGKPFLIETLDGTTTNVNLFSRIINKWARADYGNGRNFVKLIQSIKQTFDGDSSHRDTAQETLYDDTNGNVATSTNWGEVTGNADGTFADIGSDKAVTAYTYAASSTNTTMSLPSREIVTDQTGNTVKDTKWYYDTQSFGTAIKGNTTKTEQLKSGATYINTQKTYDTYGNILTSIDPLGNTTTFAYDAYNLYPTTSTNPLNQASTFTYDYATGKILTSTDANSRTLQTDYDGLGRTIKEWQPDFTTPSTLVALNEYTYTDSTSTPSSIFKRTYLSVATSTDSYTYFDGLGRTTQSKREAEAANGWITRDTQYNNIGSVDRDSLPYFTSANTYGSATSAPALFTNYRYDPEGRITTVANAVGTTTNTYSDWRLTVTDALNNKKDMIKDAYGNLAQVVEWPTSTTSATTTYAWNLLGKMTKLTDALGNIRNFTYDTIGRLTGSEDLHAAGDTTFGTTSRQYDNASNLIQQYSPLGLATSYTYDALNRVLTEDATSTAAGLTDIIYRYDTCTNGKGRLCEVNANNAATTTYAYNPIGLTTTEAKKIGSTWATTSTTYLRTGVVDTLTYPNGHQIANIYNDAGDLNRVFSLALGSTTWRKVIESTNYGPTGQPIFIDYGNNTMTWFTYDQSKLYRLTRKLTVSTSTISGVPETLILN